MYSVVKVWGERIDVPIKIIEKRDQVKAQLDERLFLVLPQCPKDLRGIVHMVLVKDPIRKLIMQKNVKLIDNSDAWLFGTRRTED